MNKKILLTTITVFFLFVGCSKVAPNNTAKQNAQSPVETATSATIDYDQYIKKTWVVKNGTNNGSYEGSSFCISKIANGEITGYFVSHGLILPNRYYYLSDHSSSLGYLTGTITNDTAECKFSDKDGNKGTMKLSFKANNEMEATINFMDKSKINKDQSLDGDFQFIPYNLTAMKDFSVIKDQSFTVDLNSWGNVKFVSGKGMGGNHIPTLFYLTDKDENILYDFSPELPYSVDVNAVSFQDVNKDGLKDIIIIVVDAYNVPTGSGGSIATVYFQKTDGSFHNDPKLDQEINDSGNNKNVKTITDYLSKKL